MQPLNNRHFKVGAPAPEGFIWPVALVLLYNMHPHGHGYSMCPLSLLGYREWCPGCGLGHAIYYAMHGQFALSLRHHWLGVPALLILCWRSYKLFIYNLKYVQQRYAKPG